MPYAGLMTLIAVAVIGILIGSWAQRRDMPSGEGVASLEEGRVQGVGEEAVELAAVEGVDPQLVAVIAAAIAAGQEGGTATVWTRLDRGTVSSWVLSGRQELHSNLPVNLRWRSGK
ncbi:MAG: hypothetical protein IMW96_02990 [Thermoanaerobacteraceae bacterium]|nr:hypothetical protein [Thermoanaerobacteraceae bacterium]